MMFLHAVVLFAFAATVTFGRAPPGPWDAFNYAPKSKVVYPSAIHSTHGTVKDSNRLILNAGSATISSRGSWIALDYGVEVNKLNVLIHLFDHVY